MKCKRVFELISNGHYWKDKSNLFSVFELVQLNKCVVIIMIREILEHLWLWDRDRIFYSQDVFFYEK